MKLSLTTLLLFCLASRGDAGVWRKSSYSQGSVDQGSFVTGVKMGLAAVGNIFSGAVRLTGNVLPLRGLAGLLSDTGVPGGVWLRTFLTPEHMRRWDRRDQQPSYREDLLYMVGAALGEKECVRKLACRSGKRVSSVPGSSLVTLVLFGVASHVPEVLREPYTIMRDSILYSDDCDQYDCTPR